MYNWIFCIFIGYFAIHKIAFVFSSFDIALSMKILLFLIPIYNINKILILFNWTPKTKRIFDS